MPTIAVLLSLAAAIAVAVLWRRVTRVRPPSFPAGTFEGRLQRVETAERRRAQRDAENRS